MLAFIMENGPTILQLLTSFVGSFAIIATLTPNDADNRIVQVLLTIINKFGGNMGKASNG